MAAVQILWDASGLVKRYYSEAGQATVNALFAVVPPQEMSITAWGYLGLCRNLLHPAQTLQQRRARLKRLSSAFRDARTELQMEALGSPGFVVLSISDALVFGSLSLMAAHNINSADASILATCLRFQRTAAEPCLLVASDKRLLRAAEAEGLSGLNPEEAAPDGVPGALARV